MHWLYHELVLDSVGLSLLLLSSLGDEESSLEEEDTPLLVQLAVTLLRQEQILQNQFSKLVPALSLDETQVDGVVGLRGDLFGHCQAFHVASWQSSLHTTCDVDR